LTISRPNPADLFYVIEAKVSDEKGRKQTTRTSFYVVGGGFVSWQRNDTDRIDLVADKALYDIGETAKILVKSPYPEAEALLTTEREGVLTTRRVTLEGAASTLSIPIDESMVPNVYVGLLLVRGRVPGESGIETGEDPGRPAVRVGYTALKVEKKSKRLAVKITPDAEQKRPRETVKLALDVTGLDGKGRRAELAVWAVDEGVLRLTGYDVPDPVEAMHPRRGLSVRLAEPLMHLVLERLFGEKGAAAGGSGGGDSSGAGIRSKFKTTAIFVPSVVTDDKGHAALEFKLPDNLTTFRIMAVAATSGDLFGSGQSKVVVSKPLLALPSLPRIARVGDRFEAGVVVHSKGVPAGEVKVTAQAEGIGLSGPSEKRVSLSEGRPQEVRFAFTPDGAGVSTLTFRVEGGAEKDAVTQKLPILLPVSMEAVAAYGDTTDRRTEGLVPPQGVRPGVGGLELTLASTVLGSFDEGMRQLVDYPYGCLEQLSSRLVPFIALREIYGRFGVAAKAPSAKDVSAERERAALVTRWLGEPALALHDTTDPDEVVRRTVKSIEQLQGHDGGFRMWPTSVCAGAYASSYAVLSLVRAQEVGFPVTPEVVEKGKRFLADTVAAGKCTDCGFGCRKPEAETRVFALYTLARARSAKPSYYGELFKDREQLPLFARAQLADAMYIGGGDRAQAKQVLTEIMNFAKESPSEVHFEEPRAGAHASMWSSDTRTTAIVLGTLADITPDHPFVAKIGRHLVKSRRASGRFANTQEAAQSLLALTEVLRSKEKEVPDFTARVLLGEKELAAAPFKGRSLDVKRESVPIDRLTVGAGNLPLVFAKDGPGVLYYGALLRYAPQELPVSALDQGMVVQRWFEPFAGGGQAKKFFAGDLVRIRVRVGTHQTRHFVAIDVPIPSGLEPVDTSLATTAQHGGEEADGESPSSPWVGAFYSPFNHVERRDDRVALFADILPPGVHTSSFLARATTPGDYVLAPARAEEMYTPEVFGRSDGGRFVVATPAQVAER
jgi:uncharacterized protein YfaS (alpha-2-macroglobulin family)